MVGGEDRLFEAACDGDLKEARMHLEEGADVNARDKRGGTPLHRAAHKIHAGVAKVLLAAGADVNARSEQGLTPLQLAEFNSLPNDTAVLLRKRGGVK